MVLDRVHLSIQNSRAEQGDEDPQAGPIPGLVPLTHGSTSHLFHPAMAVPETTADIASSKGLAPASACMWPPRAVR